MVEVNGLAVVVGTVGYVVLGALWYGPVFGSVWMDAMGYEGPERVDGEDSTTGYVLTTVGSLSPPQRSRCSPTGSGPQRGRWG